MDLMERFEFECFWETMESFYGSKLEDRFCRLLWQFPCKKFSQFEVPTRHVDFPFQSKEFQCEISKRFGLGFGRVTKFMEMVENDYGPMIDSKLPAEFRDVYLSLGNKVGDIALDDFENVLLDIKRAKISLPRYQSLKLNLKKLSAQEKREKERFEYECFWETIEKYNDAKSEDNAELYSLMWKHGFRTHGCFIPTSPENVEMNRVVDARHARCRRNFESKGGSALIDEDETASSEEEDEEKGSIKEPPMNQQTAYRADAVGQMQSSSVQLGESGNRFYHEDEDVALYVKEFGCMTEQELSRFDSKAVYDLSIKMETVDVNSFDKHLQYVRRKNRMKRTAAKAIKIIAIVTPLLLSVLYFLNLL